MPMALASGRPPDDCKPTTSTRTTIPRNSCKSQGEWITQILENHTKTSAHDVEKYMEELELVKKKLRVKRSYHEESARVLVSPYKIQRNELDGNDENTVSKTTVPRQRTMVDNKEKLEKERKRNSNGTTIPFQRKMANTREESRSYESRYTDLGKENTERKPDQYKIKQTMAKEELFTWKTIPRPSRGQVSKKLATPNQKTLAIKEDERNKDEILAPLHEKKKLRTRSY